MAYRRRTASSPVAPIVGGIVLLLVVVGVAWFFLRPVEPLVDEWAPSALDRGEEAPPGAMAPDADDPEPLDLPPLSASDDFVRQVVARLSAHPELARWLVSDALVERFVGFVLDLAGGFHPAEHAPFLRPAEPFQVETVGGRQVMAEASHRRYDPMVAVIQSLDVDGSVRLFRQLRPLIDEAWAARGAPGSFDDALALALRNLRDVPLPEGRVEVVQDEGVWVFADPEFERLRGAAKALLRTGPENARRLQARGAEFEARLGLAPPAD